MPVEKVTLEGAILDNGFASYLREQGEPAISVSQVRDIVSKANENGYDLEIDLTTPGGMVDEAYAIISAFQELQTNVTLNVKGLVASAGTIIASSFGNVKMYEPSTYMIHEVGNFLYGTYQTQDLKKLLAVHDNDTKQILSLYEKKTGQSKEKLQDMLTSESWLTPDEALENGFVDEVVAVKLNSNVELPQVDYKSMMTAQIEKVNSAFKAYSENKGESQVPDKNELVENKVVAEPTKDNAEVTVTTDEVVENAEVVESTDTQIVNTLSEIMKSLNALNEKLDSNIASNNVAETTDEVVDEVAETTTNVVKETNNEVVIERVEATETAKATNTVAKNRFGFAIPTK